MSDDLEDDAIPLHALKPVKSAKSSRKKEVKDSLQVLKEPNERLHLKGKAFLNILDKCKVGNFPRVRLVYLIDKSIEGSTTTIAGYLGF